MAFISVVSLRNWKEKLAELLGGLAWSEPRGRALTQRGGAAARAGEMGTGTRATGTGTGATTSRKRETKKIAGGTQRAAKRQAAQFSRGKRKENPKPPGRKPGPRYGRHYLKVIPEKVDEVIRVGGPKRCECGGQLELEEVASQYQQ